MTLDVKALILKNEHYDNLLAQEAWDYKDMKAHKGRATAWSSFDCLQWNPDDDCVYCGITDFSQDIFYRYNRKLEKFETMDYPSVPDATFDAKFHRSLERDDDGTLWAATALLHDVDQYNTAPGGSIIHIDPATKKIEKVCIPIPHVYIQAIVLDRKRRLIHGITFTPEKLFTYNITTGEVTDHGQFGSGFAMAQPECPALDSNGTFWSFWGVTRAWMSDTGPRPFRLLSLNPDTMKLTFHDVSLPKLTPADTGKADGMLTGRDGYVYIGSGAGALYRLDPKTVKVTYIGKPVPGVRMAGMAYGPDGNIYMACGRPDAYIVRFTPGPDTFEVLGKIRDESINDQAFQIHDITITDDGTIYGGENDNFARSGYLWECKIKA